MSSNGKLLRLISLQEQILSLHAKRRTRLIQLESRLYANYFAFSQANQEYNKNYQFLARELKSLQAEILNGVFEASMSLPEIPED
jgi:hypothetical protein